MKNHELLDLIGEANEDYVLASGDNVVRPQFRWKTLAACAACAALVLGAYPVYRAVNPPLHGYTVVEGGGSLTTENEMKIPTGGDIPIVPGGAYVGGDTGNGIDGTEYSAPGQDVPAQEEATAQYLGLLQSLGGQGGYEPEAYPDWFAGAWIDNDWPDNVGRLTVAIVDSFRTPELEAQILDWCGGTGDVLFCGAKYSQTYLEGLMDPATQALNGTGLCCGIGVDVSGNCLGVDLYSDEAAVPISVLAELARLDPAGDAIRVRVFTQSMSTLTDEVKGPAPGGRTEPVYDGARAEPNVEYAPAPIGDSEWTMPAEEPGEIEDLPQPKAAAESTPDPAGCLPDIIEGEDE